MKRTNGILFTVLLTLLLLTAPIPAQPGPGNGGPGPGMTLGNGPGGNGPGQDRPRRGYDGILPSRIILVRVLDLTDEQLAEVQALIEDIQTTFGPLREQLAMLAEDLQAELSMETPDPLVVGQIVITMHDLRTQIADLREQFRDEFLSILTDEQRAKLQEFIDAHQRHGDEQDPGTDG